MTLSFSSLAGGTSFTVITSTGGSKTATLTKTFPAGTYLIESMAGDTNLEVYLGASDGTQVGSCVAGAKSVTASASFLYVTTVNADTNDAVTFTLKSAATLATKTDAFWAPPTITDITPSGLPNVDDTTTITGTNFASNVDVKFRKSDDSTLVTPKTTVRGSATSIIAGRPDSFAPGDAPYDVIVTNPSTTLSASSLNAITSGAVPVWVTSTTLNAASLTQAFSQTIQATDADGGSSITYAIVSGALQTGLSLNTATGEITGTPTGDVGNTTITISATDSGGNVVNRTFTQVIDSPGVLVDTLVIAGGGGNYAQYGGGGAGAGGLVYSSGNFLNYSANHSVTVGAGGTRAANGSNSQFASLTAAIGGGYGGSQGSGTSYTGQNGGSGGGGGTGGTYYPGGTGSQGGNGGSGNSSGVGGGGGGGGAGGNGNPASGSTGGVGGAGTSTYSSWGAATLTGQNVSGTYWYAGGGGGGAFSGTPAIGGNGGGGNGVNDNGDSVTGAGRNGKPSTGGGGGGTSSGFTSSGGSGLVIARYLGSQVAIGGDVTSSGGYTYHTFTRSSNLSFGTGSSSGSKATGGIVFQDATYYYHVFNSTGTFVPSAALSSVHYLNVAGGGGGGSGRAGGGGAGGYLTNISGSAVSMVSGTTYTITVGSGGAG